MEVEQPEQDSPAPSTPTTPTTEIPPATNAPLTKITNIFKLLTGVLRNATICKEFIKDGGLDLVLNIADLPCIPIRFSPTDAAVAFPSVLRVIGEHDQIQLTERLVEAVKQDLNALPELWKSEDARDNWWALLNENGSAEDHSRFRRAAGFAMRLSFLSEYLASNFGVNRTSTQLIKVLGVGSGSDFVPNLGLLHRVMIQEHCIMKQFNMDVEPPSVPTVESAQVTAQAAQAAQPPATAATEGAPETAGSVPAADPAAAPAADATTDPAVRVVEAGSEDDSAVEKKITRASTVKTLVTRFQSILIKFFKGGLRCMCTFC
jgi:E3 ubiquitin-protein ligase HUWE1